MGEGEDFFIGSINGCLGSIPLWALIIWGVIETIEMFT